LENYAWPGNVRELKNVAEQLSVLSEDRLVSAEQLLEIIPGIAKRHLPVATEAVNGGSAESFQEREILFKFLFDMKHDLNDLKSLVFELVRRNNLEMPETGGIHGLSSPVHPRHDYANGSFEEHMQDFFPEKRSAVPTDPSRPIILDRGDKPGYEKVEVVDENLNMADMEKDLILKALKKHNNRRKDAASDLGISERTLYRKIKEYELE
jgi:transcriptional regulator with PAS, ATPase and Fis domain